MRDSLSAAEEEERKIYFAVADGSRNGGIEDWIGWEVLTAGIGASRLPARNSRGVRGMRGGDQEEDCNLQLVWAIVGEGGERGGGGDNAM